MHETEAIPLFFWCDWRGAAGEASHGAASQRGLLTDGMAAMLRKSRESYQHKILIALVFFVLKFAWFLIKDSNLSLY